jgi:hypothetical protein
LRCGPVYFFLVLVLDVEVVPVVVVDVVPDVVVAVVAVVPEVSLIVLGGIAEVDVDELVSVAIVEDVSVADALVSVLLAGVSLLQAKPNTHRARTVRRTRSFLLICFFLSLLNGCGSPGKFDESACSPPLAID